MVAVILRPWVLDFHLWKTTLTILILMLNFDKHLIAKKFSVSDNYCKKFYQKYVIKNQWGYLGIWNRQNHHIVLNHWKINTRQPLALGVVCGQRLKLMAINKNYPCHNILITDWILDIPSLSSIQPAWSFMNSRWVENRNIIYGPYKHNKLLQCRDTVLLFMSIVLR